MGGRWAVEVNICSLYDEKKGGNSFTIYLQIKIFTCHTMYLLLRLR